MGDTPRRTTRKRKVGTPVDNKKSSTLKSPKEKIRDTKGTPISKDDVPQGYSKRSVSQFEWIEQLPIPVLHDVLLNMERRELNVICNDNRRAYGICSLPLFRELYEQKHSPQNNIFSGKLSFLGIDPKYNRKYGKVFWFIDEAKTRLNVTVGIAGKISTIDYIPSVKPQGIVKFRRDFQKRSGKKGSPLKYVWRGKIVTLEGQDMSEEDTEIFLRNINKIKWIPNSSGEMEHSEVNDTMKRIEKEIGKHMDKLFKIDIF